MTRWDAVRTWRDTLATTPPVGETGLSPQGLAEGLAAALGALTDDALARVAAMNGRAFAQATVVVAGTVPTAAIEWCAVLLGRGTAVTLKFPGAEPGLAPWFAETAQHSGLPLTATDDRDATRGAELVVAMGSDASIAAIRASIEPTTRFLPHGHRHSLAWITAEASWDAIAADAALYDGRGCLSPTTVFTPLDPRHTADRLQAALDAAAGRWPIGEVSAGEHAAIRTRAARARVAGYATEGLGGSVHVVPPGLWRPEALPRSIAVVQAPNVQDAGTTLGTLASWLSTVGTDDAAAADAWFDAGASRVCAPGQMQRPPLFRSHDGEDWLTATFRFVSRD